MHLVAVGGGFAGLEQGLEADQIFIEGALGADAQGLAGEVAEAARPRAVEQADGDAGAVGLRVEAEGAAVGDGGAGRASPGEAVGELGGGEAAVEGDGGAERAGHGPAVEVGADALDRVDVGEDGGVLGGIGEEAVEGLARGGDPDGFVQGEGAAAAEQLGEREAGEGGQAEGGGAGGGEPAGRAWAAGGEQDEAGGGGAAGQMLRGRGQTAAAGREGLGGSGAEARVHRAHAVHGGDGAQQAGLLAAGDGAAQGDAAVVGGDGDGAGVDDDVAEGGAHARHQHVVGHGRGVMEGGGKAGLELGLQALAALGGVADGFVHAPPPEVQGMHRGVALAGAAALARARIGEIHCQGAGAPQCHACR